MESRETAGFERQDQRTGNKKGTVSKDDIPMAPSKQKIYG